MAVVGAAVDIFGDVGPGRVDLLQLRVFQADGDAERSAALENAQAGDTQPGILPPRLFDQARQHRVAKAPPPAADVIRLRVRGNLAIQIRLPGRQPVDMRLAEVGPQRRAGHRAHQQRRRQRAYAGTGGRPDHPAFASGPVSDGRSGSIAYTQARKIR